MNVRLEGSRHTYGGTHGRTFLPCQVREEHIVGHRWCPWGPVRDTLAARVIGEANRANRAAGVGARWR